MGGDFVVDRVGADENADQLAPRSRGADALDIDAFADVPLDFFQTLADHLDRSRTGSRIDFLQDIAVLVDGNEICADAADIDSEVGGNPVFPLGEFAGFRLLAEECDPVEDQFVGRWKLRGDFLRLERAVEGGRRGSITVRPDGCADGGKPVHGVRHDDFAAVEPEYLPHGLEHPRVHGNAADEEDGRDDLPAPRDRTLEVARHCVAQALQHLVRLVTALLGVNHVGFRENGAAACDLGGLGRTADDSPHIGYVVFQAGGLLVHESARSRGAIAVRSVIEDAERFPFLLFPQEDVFRRFPAHFEDGADGRMELVDGFRDGGEFVEDRGAVTAGCEFAAGTGDDDGQDVVRGRFPDDREQLGESGERPALVAPIPRQGDRKSRSPVP